MTTDTKLVKINYIGSRATIPGWPDNGTIEGLLDALSRWELDKRLDFSGDPRFPAHEDRKPFRGPTLRAGGKKWSGDLNDYRYVDGPPMYSDHPTAVQFVGNFVGHNFVFNIDTDDRELIAQLDQAIALNIARFRSTDLARIFHERSTGWVRDAGRPTFWGAGPSMRRLMLCMERVRRNWAWLPLPRLGIRAGLVSTRGPGTG